LPGVWGVGCEATEEAGNVAGDGVEPHRAEIDDAGDLIAGDEEMGVPDVAQARLDRSLDIKRGPKLAL